MNIDNVPTHRNRPTGITNLTIRNESFSYTFPFGRFFLFGKIVFFNDFDSPSGCSHVIKMKITKLMKRNR